MPTDPPSWRTRWWWRIPGVLLALLVTSVLLFLGLFVAGLSVAMGNGAQAGSEMRECMQRVRRLWGHWFGGAPPV